MAAEPEPGLIADSQMAMTAGQGSSDAENGVKMAARDRNRGTGPGTAAAAPAPTGPAGDVAETRANGPTVMPTGRATAADEGAEPGGQDAATPGGGFQPEGTQAQPNGPAARRTGAGRRGRLR